MVVIYLVVTLVTEMILTTRRVTEVIFSPWDATLSHLFR
jgi:hypothetical protein